MPLDDVRGHFLHDVDRIVQIQLVKDLFELGVRKAADQHLLRVGIELDEHLRRGLFGKEPEQKGNAVLVQIFKKRGDIRGLQVCKQVAQRGILFSLEQILDSFQQFVAHFDAFCQHFFAPAVQHSAHGLQRKPCFRSCHGECCQQQCGCKKQPAAENAMT